MTTARDWFARYIEPKIAKTDTCWLWTGHRMSNGYGRVSVRHVRSRLAHRVVYEHLVGPIPEGLSLDHVHARGCRHKHCVNPAHLEPVTSGENTRRWSDLKTHCAKGHPYDEENDYRSPDGKRKCRRCNAEHQRWRRSTGATVGKSCPISPGDGDPRHGTRNGYTALRCRCERCRAAAAAYQRQVRAARKPVEPP